MIQFDEDKQRSKLAQLRAEEEEELVQILAKKNELSYTDLTTTPINTDALRLIREKDARQAQVAAFDVVGKTVSIATRAPTSTKVQEVLSGLTERGYQSTIFMTSERSLESAWTRYADLSYARESKAGALDVSNAEIKEFLDKAHGLDDVKKFIEETLRLKRASRISRIVEVFVGAALATNASDIHIEPEEEGIRLRLRLDGILTDVSQFNEDTYSLLLSRIKLLSGLKLNIKNEAQDGRFSIELDESEIEVRTSVIPGQYGESIVMRILDPNAFLVDVDHLGIDSDLLDIIKEEIGRPNGMVLATGPTGSGKTTTLYAFLRHIHKPSIKIITIEDPIEYHLKGVVQTQVDRAEKYSFSSGLRAIVRQDPDVILVGEIRDRDTAEVAVHAALTGHLVLSTLHTNNAAGTFPRLIDLGVGSDVIGSAMNLALAERLVRKLCDECKEEVPVEGPVHERITEVLESVVHKEKIRGVERGRMWVAKGCDACGGTGYKGRIGIFEGIRMNEAIENAVRSNSSEHEIREAAAPQGLLTMPQDGVLKVLRGITSFEELIRVIDLTEK
ncbi:GspE/PulE family protein [Candidatus Wolfebacteria bacterium]|nr:GspE/PulE family protein [Candidatus Wolfebacteria bacterium]